MRRLFTAAFMGLGLALSTIVAQAAPAAPPAPRDDMYTIDCESCVIMKVRPNMTVIAAVDHPVDVTINAEQVRTYDVHYAHCGSPDDLPIVIGRTTTLGSVNCVWILSVDRT